MVRRKKKLAARYSPDQTTARIEQLLSENLESSCLRRAGGTLGCPSLTGRTEARASPCFQLAEMQLWTTPPLRRVDMPGQVQWLEDAQCSGPTRASPAPATQLRTIEACRVGQRAP